MIAYPGESLADVISSGFGAELILIPEGATIARTGEASSSSDFEDGAMFEKVSYMGRSLWVDRAKLDAAQTDGSYKVAPVEKSNAGEWAFALILLALGWVLS